MVAPHWEVGGLGSGSFDQLTKGFFTRANLGINGLSTFFSTGNPFNKANLLGGKW